MMLSIIIPAFNVEKYISETINSLIIQTNKDFEIIVVDDGSKDNTYKTVEETLQRSKFPNFKVVKKQNGGVSSARNRGILEAKGQYLLFLDGDDYVADDLVATIYPYLTEQKEEVDVLCWGYDEVNPNKDIVSSYFNKYENQFCCINGKIALDKLVKYKTLSIWTGSAVYNRKLINNYKFRYTEGCASGEDQEFTLKFLAKSQRVIFINKVLSFYLIRPTSISNIYNIRKFDAISAMSRTASFLIECGSAYEECSRIIGYDKVIESYLVNFSSCLKSLCNSGGYIERIENDLDQEYPGLRKDISLMMKNYRGENKKLAMKIFLFMASPKIYNIVLGFLSSRRQV